MVWVEIRYQQAQRIAHQLPEGREITLVQIIHRWVVLHLFERWQFRWDNEALPALAPAIAPTT
jgi:hypothetical protein